MDLASHDGEERYRMLFDSMDQAYCVIEMLFDGNGKPVDYRFLEVNAAFIKMTGWAQAAGTRMRQLAPDHEQYWFEIYGKVAVTGEPIRFVQQANILDARWFDLYAFRLGDGHKVAVLFSDITEARADRQALAGARKELDEIIELAPSFMCVLRGPEFKIEVANEAYRRLVGGRDSIGLPLRQVFPEVEGQGFFESIDRVYATGQPWVGSGVPISLQRQEDKPREVRYLDLVYQALRGADGAISGVFAHGVDITERRLAEQALREAAEQAAYHARVFDTTLSAITDFAYTFDREGRFRYVNKALLDLWGLSLGDALGKNFFDLAYPQELAAKLQAQIEQVFETGEGLIDETPYTSPTGVAGHYEYIFRPVIGADGRTEMVAGSTRDITVRKRAEDALKEADRRKSEFLAMLAHELRNPLAPIHSAVQILRATKGKHERAEALYEMMDRQVTHMSRLVDDLLDASRISRGKVELHRERLDLASVVEQAVEVVRPVCQTRNHVLTVVLPSEPVVLSADSTRIVQILGNLLNNACKFSKPGDAIRLSAEREGDQAVMRVSDYGVGIAPENLLRVFDMFTQLDSSLDRSRGGLGIGLTLVKDLVEMHEGTIEARSEGVGRGSEFVVRLPLLMERLT